MVQVGSGAEGQDRAFPQPQLPDGIPRDDEAARARQDGWEAIDEHSPLDCFLSPFNHLDNVPDAHRQDWALAVVDVLEYIENARRDDDALRVERGLKWKLVLHDVLLRGKRRGGQRGSNTVTTRFRLLHEGQRDWLLEQWRRE